MAPARLPLGHCPRCGGVLRPETLLAVRTGDGWPTTYAECPRCERVVNPR